MIYQNHASSFNAINVTSNVEFTTILLQFVGVALICRLTAF